jgi:hypothetical protein
MPEQNYSSHAQRVPLFLACGLILLLSFIGACVIVAHSFNNRPAQLHLAMLVASIALASFVGLAMCRTFALKVQDRAIRSEENLRHYVLTGKLLDKRLTVKQIVAVRFASDDQFAELAREAAEKNMVPDDIKKAVRNWRADFDRA